MTAALPMSVWEGELKIGSFRIRAYVLEDGRRLLSPEDVARFFVDGAELTLPGLVDDMRRLAAFTTGKGIPMALPNETSVQQARRLLKAKAEGKPVLLSDHEWHELIRGLVGDADRYTMFKKAVYEDNDTSLDAYDAEGLDTELDRRIAAK